MGLFKKEKITILGVDFPYFNGKKRFLYTSNSKNTERYQRWDYYFKNDPEKLSEYLIKLGSYGFMPISSIKYIKNNAYIIVENYAGGLHIAFHVNK